MERERQSQSSLRPSETNVGWKWHWGTTLIVILVAFGSFSLGIITGAWLVGMAPKKVAVSTMTPEPIWMARPTSIATATPVPRATATPTATALPRLTLSGWGREVLPHGEIVADALYTMGDLLSNPLLGDATWDRLLATQVVKIREADAALRNIVPPEECQEAHAMLLSATGDAVLGAEYALEGVREADVDLMEQATKYFTSAAAKINLYSLMVEAMTP